MSPLLLLLGPLALLLAAGLAFAGPGLRPRGALRAAEGAALLALAGSGAAAVLLAQGGAATAALLPGLAARLDVVSATMALLVSGLGWIVLRYAARLLDGDARQGTFTGWLALTLAAVLLMVSAGHVALLALGWIATAAGLHRLLLFYAARPEARRAARKKAFTARLADLALVAAAALLWWGAGTGDIAAINAAAAAGTLGPAAPAAGLLALAAVLKSALFPLHGWLVESMETPTPVSALLHAGIVNGGGFLLIRFADVLLASPAAMAALAAIGGLSALVGSLVMLTQPAAKTALAWSTVAQMGFMILQCGFGLWALALLHIVAHSLYKAHAFLSAGTAVAAVEAARRPGPVAVPSAGAVARAFALALVIYAAVGLLFGLPAKSPQAVALGAILVLGTAYLIAQGLADAAPRALARRTAVASAATALAYFSFQWAAEAATAGTLPLPPAPGPLEWALIGLAVLSFAAAAWAQATFPLWAGHPAARGLRVHLQNGLYANALFDRLTRGWAAPAARQPAGSPLPARQP
ncbi:proton-conducting transporter membrane subunit [Rubellimicrobium sp. CFH 75288]|uniref:proton-conducting transporter transmembrane domain-containing protein n=1 Tax=Rubellimicrobium sp. CFH 75288 TaxID=2697034 RepID=UPI001412B7B9|nr:proton-conducting transporter membrane subunit [Rubellimicrobium sp. CFH 75288]NAZ37561.1 oxidoreductase [Rubellimicrobium sp. CFH 75288]